MLMKTLTRLARAMKPITGAEPNGFYNQIIRISVVAKKKSNDIHRQSHCLDHYRHYRCCLCGTGVALGHLMMGNDQSANSAAFEKFLTALPLATYRAGETILLAGSKTGRLLILKSGAVAILKDSIEIATIDEPGAVLGEISALLDQPHSADVRTLEDSQFRVAEAAQFANNPNALLYVAKNLERRLIAADDVLVQVRKELDNELAPSKL
jgi:CRP/FNR family cyclic AMP-dependent transcriptional regulator